MPIPIKPGYLFDVSHSSPEVHSNMKAPEMCRDFYEIGFTIQGERACIVENNVVIIHAGDVGVTNQNTIYRTTSISDIPHEKILIKFRPEAVTPLIEVIGKDMFEQFVSCPVYQFSPNTQVRIRAMFEDMYNESLFDEPFTQLILQGLLHKLIINILRLRTLSTPSAITIHQNNQFVMNAIYYIESNYHKDPSLIDVARVVNLTPFYFSKLFKDSIGVTYSQYLNHVKHQHVRLLLAQTNLSLEEIAPMCGFSSRNYMCNIFKQIDGRTPKRYRDETT